MNDLQIEAFLAVIKYNSFSKASKAIYVPQPTITHRIQQLEKLLGKNLIYHTNKSFALTEAGRSFLPYARQIQEAMMKGKEKVNELHMGIAGTIHVGISYALSLYAFPAFMKGFVETNPNVELNITTGPSDKLVKLLQDKVIAVGLIRHYINDTKIICKEIETDRVLLVANNEHNLFKEGRKISLEEVLKEKIILYPKGTFYRNMLEDSLKSYELSFYHPIEVNNSELIKYMIKENMGISFLPEMYVRESIKNNEMKEIPLDVNPFPMQKTYICYSREYIDGITSAFIKAAKEYDWNNCINNHMKSDI